MPVRRTAHILLLALATFGLALAGRAQTIRLGNGIIIKGEAKAATGAGLEVQTPAGVKTYPWESLSTATRFRYQPSFRANFDVVLQGLPPDARVHKPDVPAAAATPEKPKEEAAAPDAGATESVSLKIFDQAQYENVDSFSVSQFPGLQLRTPAAATYIGLQYGPRSSDVIYMAFDPKSPSEPRDILFLYSPGTAAYSNTVRMTGFKKTVADNRIVDFKRFKLSGRFGQVSADSEIECQYSAVLSNQLTLIVNVDLYKGDTKNRFVLSGEVTDLIQSDGAINVKGILDLPVLWVSLDLSSGSAQLIGNLNMSHLKLMPKEGTENRVLLVLKTEQDEVVFREAVKLDEKMFDQKYGITAELKKVPPGTYRVLASIDLGPFLGPATFEDKITIPAAAGQ